METQIPFSKILDNISTFYKNKKYEWEDVERHEHNYNITTNFNDWIQMWTELDEKFNIACKDIMVYQPRDKTFFIDNVTPLLNYIDGYLLGTTGICNGVTIEANPSKSFNTHQEVIDYVKELKLNNDKLLLYNIELVTTVLGDEKYKIRLGLVPI